MTTPALLLKTLHLGHSIITETPMHGRYTVHQIQKKSVAKNNLKTGIPPKKRAELMGRRDNTANKKVLQ